MASYCQFAVLQWQKYLDMKYDSFKLLVFGVKSVVFFFFAAVKQMEESGNYSYHKPIRSPHPVRVESGGYGNCGNI